MKGRRPLLENEVTRMLASLPESTKERDTALIVLGLKTGFRISELLSLTVGDVYQHGRLVDRVAVARRSMKGKRAGRSVPLHAQAKDALAAWLKMYARRHGDLMPSLPLFVSRQRGADGALQAIGRHTAWQMIVETAEACGLTGALGCHSLRKAFAKSVYERLNHDLLGTQRAMGHANIQSTISYLSFDQAAVDAAILA